MFQLSVALCMSTSKVDNVLHFAMMLLPLRVVAGSFLQEIWAENQAF